MKMASLEKIFTALNGAGVRYLAAGGCKVRTVDNPGILLRANAHGQLQLDYQATYEGIAENLGKADGVQIVAAGTAHTEQGAYTALRPDGGDLSASLIAAALDAELDRFAVQQA